MTEITKRFDPVQCAKDCVERHHVCGGCGASGVCKVGARFNLSHAKQYLEMEKNPVERAKLEKKINRLIKHINDGDAYEKHLENMIVKRNATINQCERDIVSLHCDLERIKTKKEN